MVKSVDVEIMGELDSEKESQNNTKTKNKKTAKGCNFGQLSQRLHIARMQLVELARRNDFESKVCKQLQEDLTGEVTQLRGRVNTYSAMTKSDQLDIKSLPERISSQTTVVSLCPKPHAPFSNNATKSALTHTSLVI